ncbi:hypothetical protein A3K72_00065 [Candidatus Woesearchaeota archaeon RBG_13_36_6]|nr:MAG: hypothetical protein A3K72_00065 [Candidatus Woesearchaeota archaeon RBG_13_36_6]
MARDGRKTNTTTKGRKLEVYVEQLFKDLGKWFVKRNVYYSFRSVLRDRVVRRVQVDVQYYDLYGKTIVECKHYDVWRVSAQAVEDFDDTVRLVKPSNALLITNSSLTREAQGLAEEYGIQVYDGEGLKMLDQERQGLRGIRKTLEEQLKDVDLRRYPREHYSIKRYVLV